MHTCAKDMPADSSEKYVLTAGHMLLPTKSNEMNATDLHKIARRQNGHAPRGMGHLTENALKEWWGNEVLEAGK